MGALVWSHVPAPLRKGADGEMDLQRFFFVLFFFGLARFAGGGVFFALLRAAVFGVSAWDATGS